MQHNILITSVGKRVALTKYFNPSLTLYGNFHKISAVFSF